MRPLGLIFLVACRPASYPDTAEMEASAELVPLSPTRQLRRASLDLRGVLPELSELEAVEADPEALDGLVVSMLEDPRFEERLVQIFAQRWHTTIDDFHATYFDYFLDEDQEYAFERAVGEEPLRLMAHVVATDQPWSDVVTADYSMANSLLASIWPMEGYPEAGEGWHPVQYTDGRPAVGVLASNGLWWRYFTTVFNQNRSRAAAISRLLLCEDLLNRPISFSESANLLAADDVTGMVLSEPTCQGCHVTIEPLAATLFGFWWMDDHSAPEMETYHPEREVLGPLILEVEPNYFGVPIAGFGELGHAIAADERFTRCAVKSLAEALWHRPLDLQDFMTLERAHERFVDADLQLKSLLLDLMDSEEYRAGSTTAAASGAVEARVRTARLLDASLIRSVSDQLASFRWTRTGFDMLDSDEHGYRILGGGVDGEYVSTVQQDPGLTWAVVLQRTAQGVANGVVGHDLVEAEEPRMLLDLGVDARPGDEEFERVLDDVFFRLMAERASEERLVGLRALWEELEALGGAEAAWRGVLAVLLQDPDFVVY